MGPAKAGTDTTAFVPWQPLHRQVKNFDERRHNVSDQRLLSGATMTKHGFRIWLRV